ncbi:hypothetical protein Y1Q_0020316 [Alligator mississippiensis]|uniref:Uncharacterized protein n=1 Tax=Alligator mississippiensis TaxID=8496 RepID=A0A151MSR6_ALLMI|nr:hypothetical protein Y1Q_0020316 [Alligator mississippiensis]
MDFLIEFILVILGTQVAFWLLDSPVEHSLEAEVAEADTGKSQAGSSLGTCGGDTATPVHTLPHAWAQAQPRAHTAAGGKEAPAHDQAPVERSDPAQTCMSCTILDLRGT